jgi:hypothetical protein
MADSLDGNGKCGSFYLCRNEEYELGYRSEEPAVRDESAFGSVEIASSTADDCPREAAT